MGVQERHLAAVDLGATSGRIVHAVVSSDRLRTAVTRRFATPSSSEDGALRWDVDTIWAEVTDGLRQLAGRVPLASVGVDSWAVDYGLVDDGLRLLRRPRHYREPGLRRAFADAFSDDADRQAVYSTSGTAFQMFNTLVQLRTEPAELLADADRLLLIPDLLNAWLCGHVGAEVTNASTTQLLDVRSRDWAPSLVARSRAPVRLLPPVHEPGVVLGRSDRVAGLDLTVVAVGSHDTASAVAGTPLDDGDQAYLSCGTWGLVGVECESPSTTEDARRRNITNELGVGGRVRLLKNVTGLWLVERCLDEWRRERPGVTLADLLPAAAQARTTAVLDPDDDRLHAGGAVLPVVHALCLETGTSLAPDDDAVVVRCLLQSLTRAWARALSDVEAVRGAPVHSVRLVGGGAALPLLGQLLADAVERPVLAGPVEATATGNVVAQGLVDGVWPDLDAARAVVRSSTLVHTYSPGSARR